MPVNYIDLAKHLVNDIGECEIYGQERLRRLAYACKTSENITPEMDEEILRRVARIKKHRRRFAESGPSPA
jgi:hypothetical protein